MSNRLRELYQLKVEIEKSENETLVSQLNIALEKEFNKNLTVSFMGQFSSGKSSLINFLLEDEVLPTSPVPTTSQTVQIHMQDDLNPPRVFLTDNTYTELSSIEEVQLFNRQNYSFHRVEYFSNKGKLNHKITIQDTPGIDSINAIHDHHTKKYLLASDVVIVVADYNHVLSNVNLNMMKELNKLNIPILLVISQIDKHNKDESIDLFMNTIYTTLEQHEINVENIVPVSIYVSKYNQISKLVDQINYWSNQNQFDDLYASRLKDNVFKEQLNYLQHEINSYVKKIKPIFSQVHSNMSLDQIDELKEQLNNRYTNNLELLAQSNEQSFIDYLQEKLIEYVDNSYILSQQLRSMLEDYLMTFDSSYRVKGIFNKKEKLLKIREQMVKDITDYINREINKLIIMPVNQSLQQINLSDLDLSISTSLLEATEVTTPNIQNVYVKNFNDQFIKQVKTSIKKRLSVQLKALYRQLDSNKFNNNEMSNKNDNQKLYDIKNEEDERINRYKTLIHQLQEANDTAKQLKMMKELKQSIENKSYEHFYIHMDDRLNKLTNYTFLDASEVDFEKYNDTQSDSLKHENNTEGQDDLVNQTKLHQLNESLLDIILNKELEPIQSFQSALKRKVIGLKNNKMNLSVFGAFSAGKSTLLNALVNKNLLASSAHPTTASIVYISNHDTNYVIYKDKEQLLEDAKHILNDYDIPTHDMEKYLQSNHPNNQWVVNLLTRYNQFADKLGTSEPLSDEDIKYITSDEAYSVFINECHLSYNHPLLEHYRLIDSPGFQSGNQRHNIESINHIQHADITMYIMYYQHAYTKDDEAFLEQFKEIQSMYPSKTLIIVLNAIDLRKNNEELEGVVHYIKSRLNQMNLNYELFTTSGYKAISENNNLHIKSLYEYLNNILPAQLHDRMVEEINLSLEKTSDYIDKMILHTNDKNNQRIKSLMNTLSSYDESVIIDQMDESLQRNIDQFIVHSAKRLFLKTYDEYKLNKLEINERDNKKEAFINLYRDVLFNDYTNHYFTIIEGIRKQLFTIGGSLMDEIQAYNLPIMIDIEPFVNKIYAHSLSLSTADKEVIKTIANDSVNEVNMDQMDHSIQSIVDESIQSYESFVEHHITESTNSLKQKIAEQLCKYLEELIKQLEKIIEVNQLTDYERDHLKEIVNYSKK